MGGKAKKMAARAAEALAVQGAGETTGTPAGETNATVQGAGETTGTAAPEKREETPEERAKRIAEMDDRIAAKQKARLAALKAKGDHGVLTDKLENRRDQIKATAEEIRAWNLTMVIGDETLNIADVLTNASGAIGGVIGVLNALPAGWKAPKAERPQKAAPIAIGSHVVFTEAAKGEMREMYGDAFVDAVLVVTAVQDGGMIRASNGAIVRPLFKAAVMLAPTAQ